jgi:hypothetical protein
MGFLTGSATYERFWITSDPTGLFGDDHLETLDRMAIGKLDTVAIDQPNVGFAAGDHLLDVTFDREKNIIGDAMHFGIRIDTNQVPAAVKKAWLQMELAELTRDNPSGRPTKAQREEAKEAVEARCADEAATGKFRHMTLIPVLWDAQNGVMHLGTSSSTAIEQCVNLLQRAFELELEHISSGKLAIAYADETKQRAKLDEIAPSIFNEQEGSSDIAWWNGHSGNFDFLGNEFLLWLWWRWDSDTDTIALLDESEVSGMFARTLSLECPRSETGKETISAESPVVLPEAMLAIRSGKLPRRAGLTLVRYGDQYDLTLQAESFSVGGAKIRTADEAGDNPREDRINNIRGLNETIDSLYQVFCDRRLGSGWKSDLKAIQRWLQDDKRAAKKPAA